MIIYGKDIYLKKPVGKNKDIQSVRFNRKLFTRKQAEKYIKENDYINKKVDITNKWFRYRQYTPIKNEIYRTINLKNGIHLIINIKKKKTK